MIKKDIRCKGRIPGTTSECQEIVYQSDGQFLWVANRRLNPKMRVQHIVCPNCGYTMVWRRANKFVGGDNTPTDENNFIFEKKQ